MPDQADGLQLGICTGEGGIEEEVLICVNAWGAKRLVGERMLMRMSVYVREEARCWYSSLLKGLGQSPKAIWAIRASHYQKERVLLCLGNNL